MALVGEESGERYESGRLLQLRLAEADPVSGSLRFELPEGGAEPNRRRPVRDGKRGTAGAGGPPRQGRRGRPGNIRHQGKRR